VHFELKHGNKGFEGIYYHEDDNHKYLIGLCEGELLLLLMMMKDTQAAGLLQPFDEAWNGT